MRPTPLLRLLDSPTNVLLLAVFVDMFGVALVLPNLPFLFAELGGTPESFGVLSSVYAIAQLTGGLVIGLVGDRRLGQKLSLQISFLGAALSYAVAGVATSLLLLVASRVIVGLAKQTMTCSTALLSSLTDEGGRTQALGRLSSTMALALSLGQALGAPARVAASPQRGSRPALFAQAASSPPAMGGASRASRRRLSLRPTSPSCSSAFRT